MTSLIAFVLLLVALPDLSRDLAYRAIVHELRNAPRGVIWISVLLTCISYLALATREQCSLKYVGIKIPAPAVALAAFCGSALGNAVGFGSLTASAVRDRVYSTIGVRPERASQISPFSNLAFGIALCVFAAMSSLLAKNSTRVLPLSLTSIRLISGSVILAALSIARSWIRRSGRFVDGLNSSKRRQVEQMLLQVGVSTVDLAAAAGAFWCLLPNTEINFSAFATIYSIAIVLGIVSGIPGGLGIFDVVLFVFLKRAVPSNELAATLLIYRAIYFLMPLLVAASVLAGFELRSATGRFNSRAHRRLSTAAGLLAPVFLSVVTFAVGVMLIVSGATPAVDWRLAELQRVLPLWAVETSHLLATLAGVLLLFVARGLYHRLDGAWWLAFLIALANVVFSLAKGLAFDETAAMVLLIFLLLATRRDFNRPANLLRQPFTLWWFVAIAVVIAAATGVLLFAFRDVPYQREIWWQFEFDAQASRSLRAILGASIFALGISLCQFLRAAPGRARLPSTQDFTKVARIIRSQTRSAAMMALMGDKSVLFSKSEESFLMYAKRGRSWIALFDPIGPQQEWPELIERFVELTNTYGGRAGFYQVRPQSLPVYLDAGLRVAKIGEEALIYLEKFDIEGSHRYGLRQALKRAEREGLSFQILPPQRTPSEHSILNKISDAWLASHRGSERRFSVAAFEPQFIAAQSVMLAHQHGTAIAFVTYMSTECRSDATIGLMRQVPDAPPYLMEFMITRLAMQLKAEGFCALSLGMAPLAGLLRTSLSSRWHRAAGLLWEHGESIYNFQGLRSFKAKFRPAWEPRYLAASGAISPLVHLADVALLAGGRMRRSSAA